MNIQQLQDIRNSYSSYEGTGNNKTNKMGVAVEEFKKVLDTAIFQAHEIKELRDELNNRPKRHEAPGLTRAEEIEDRFLNDEEPCEMKQTADFARYG